jgi:hypothetical protein
MHGINNVICSYTFSLRDTRRRQLANTLLSCVICRDSKARF